MVEQARQRPRALLITRNLPPLRGGMERLVQRIAQSLSDRYDLAVIGPTGSTAHLPSVVEVSEVAHRPLLRFLLAAALAAWRRSRQHSPELVVAGSGLTAPMAWFAARRAKSRLVVYLHGLDIVAPSAIYQRCWLPFIRRADLVLVNSRNTRRLAVERGVPSSVIKVLHPGTELPGPDLESRRAFRIAHGLGDRPVMLSVGRLTPRKGLPEFISRALPAILSRHPEAMLLVIGADADDAVCTVAESEQARILRSADATGVSAAVRMLPPCDDATLSAAYRAADAYVFPVLDLPGDVEGFGMVAIEAAAHGLPTVAYAVGGVLDAVIEGESGHLITQGDHIGIALAVNRLLDNRKNPAIQTACEAAAAKFSWERFSTELRNSLARETIEVADDRA